MYIRFSTKKMQKNCEVFACAKKEWGDKIAKKIVQRINEMQAAVCLQDLNYLPPTRCHPLKGKRKGQYAVDLEHPYRLVINPVLPADMSIQEIDLAQIKEVIIVEVTDYHGE